MIIKTISRVLPFAKPYRVSLCVSVFSLMAVIGVNLYSPFLARDLIDSDVWTRRSTFLAVTLAAMYLLRGIFKAVSNSLSHVVSSYTCAEIQKKAYTHAQKLSRGFYSERRTGDLLSRLSHDVDEIEALISHALPDSVTNILLAVGVSAAMLAINMPLALVTLATVLPVFAVGFFQKKVGAAFGEMNAAYSAQNAMLAENLQGIREIQLFNRMKYESGRMSARFFAVAKATARAIMWYSFLAPGVEVFTSIGKVVVIAAGGYMAATGIITAGDIVAFLLCIGLFYGPVSALSNTLETVQKAAAGVARVFELIDEPVTIKSGGTRAGRMRGEIEFDDVSFAYQSSETVLDNLRFCVPSGQTVAIIGATGAGKTTLLGLIARLFDPQSGSVKIDGADIRMYTLESLRTRLASLHPPKR